ncbi:MAG: ABC transporter permease [Clostridiales bacterium]|nr:ABC transporter permease [Clostridiales bacterium]
MSKAISPDAGRLAARAKRGGSLYFRLALANVKRSREIYIPYFLAVMIMTAVYFLTLAMLFSPGLAHMPNGETTRAVFTMCIVLITLFCFFFMLYINAFLTKRRKREFGLYSVLGLSNAHVARVLGWETLLVIAAGVLCGMAAGLLLGRLLFMLLLTMMQAAAEGIRFIVPGVAFFGTVALFFIIFAAVYVMNSLRIRLTSAMDMLKGEKAGEPHARLLAPRAILGVALLAGAYSLAQILSEVTAALFFFPLAVAVIIATYLLFHAGSIMLLRVLRNNKRVYYRQENFVAISGMFHRMRQNARGLAGICVFCTMLVVTVACTSALYMGAESSARLNMPYDAQAVLETKEGRPADIEAVNTLMIPLAARHGVKLQPATTAPVVEVTAAPQPYGDADALFSDSFSERFTIWRDADTYFAQSANAILLDDRVYFNLTGDTEKCIAFAKALQTALRQNGHESAFVTTIFESRRENYALFGGLLFLGVFFAVLFLAMAVLMIYFKQITEGYEDRERFQIMQKVGMRDDEVMAAINRQILWVFLLPLAMTLCHALAVKNMLVSILGVFGMVNGDIALYCTLAACFVFAAVYLFVYKRTAKVYYRITKSARAV